MQAYKQRAVYISAIATVHTRRDAIQHDCFCGFWQLPLQQQKQQCMRLKAKHLCKTRFLVG